MKSNKEKKHITEERLFRKNLEHSKHLTRERHGMSSLKIYIKGKTPSRRPPL